MLFNSCTFSDIMDVRLREKLNSYLYTSSSGMSSCFIPFWMDLYSKHSPANSSHLEQLAMFRLIPAILDATGLTLKTISRCSGSASSWSMTRRRSSLISVSRNLKMEFFLFHANDFRQYLLFLCTLDWNELNCVSKSLVVYFPQLGILKLSLHNKISYFYMKNATTCL